MHSQTSTSNNRQQYAYTSLNKNKPYQLIRLQLTELDNSTDRFWMFLLDNLSFWDVQLVQQQPPYFPENTKEQSAFFSALEKAVKTNPLMLEINNFQVIHNSKIHEFLSAFLKLALPDFLAVLFKNNSNLDEPLKVLTDNKYRYFSLDEEKAYYDSHGIVLSPNLFSKTRGFTDGWSSAVILFAIYLADKESRQAIEADFDTYIYQWIRQMALDKLNQQEQKLFIYFNNFAEFPLPLLQSLAGWEGLDIVELLETSPFIRRNPDTGRFYFDRYTRHVLFQYQLILDKKEKKKLAIRCGEWYQTQGQRIEAIDCYRKAGSNNKVMGVIMQWTFPMSQELAQCYYDAINAMPHTFIENNLLLHVIRAGTLCTLYRYEEAERLLEEFCIKYDQGDNTPCDIRAVLGEAYLIWSQTAVIKADAKNCVSRIKRASELLPNGSILFRSKLNRLADFPTILLPNPNAGSMQENLDFIRQLDPYLRLSMKGAGIGTPNLAAAELNFYQRNLKEAEQYATMATVDAIQEQQYDVASSAYFLLMRCNMAKGNYENLMQNLKLLEQFVSKSNYETFFTMPDIARSWLALKLGNPQGVADWIIDDYKYRDLIKPWNTGRSLIIRLYYTIEIQSYIKASATAEKIAALFCKHRQMVLAIYAWIIQAIAHNCMGEWDKTVELLETVYEWSHANRLIMPVIESGRYVPALVKTYRNSGHTLIPETWLGEMEQKAKSYQTYQNSIRQKYHAKQFTSESPLKNLTKAELNLLLMTYNGMTIQQIADSQNRSMNSIKAMLNSIYHKIGAFNMKDAVRIAGECDIGKYVNS